ncbi:MAG: DUF177 domain-containing protein [Moorea sp. SIO2B7]|nr:DUF177 domain-containing protein [Moorena sp. SIO2B7]
MEAIHIPQLLKAPEKKQELKIDDFISGLATLTPVRGVMVLRHGGNYLEISSAAETIITLTCDRCLKNYNHRLAINTSELIWLDDKSDQKNNLPLEREVPLEDLSEKLAPDAYFQPDTWLYEQLCLAIPFRKLCGQDCTRPDVTSYSTQPSIDSRWASLEVLKKQMSQ